MREYMVSAAQRCSAILCSEHNRHGPSPLLPLKPLLQQQRRTRGHQRLQQLLLVDAAQEAQRDAADVLVGVLQVVAQVLAD